MSNSEDLAFLPEEAAAIMRHMNGDHAADSTLMCRALGGLPAAENASVVGVDRAGMDFEAIVGGKKVATRIPWGHRIAARAEVRGEVVRLYREACAALGVEPRPAEQASH